MVNLWRECKEDAHKDHRGETKQGHEEERKNMGEAAGEVRLNSECCSRVNVGQDM